MSRFVIGIDAGTSVTKVCVFDQDSKLCGVARSQTEVQSPHPGWREVDPARLWRGTCEGIHQAMAAAGARPEDIVAVGLSAAMVGFYAIDATGRPVRNGITWDDGRTQTLIDEMERARPGVMSTIFASSGSVMQTGCTLPLLAWMMQHEPETIERAATVFGAKDFLGFMLTGGRATDVSEASVTPGDARQQSRSARMIELFGLTSVTHLLPEVLPSGSLLGEITTEAAAATGIRKGTPVVLGAGDVVASLIGAGATEAGDAATILGTTCLSGVISNRPVFEPQDVGLLFSMPGPAWFRSMVTIAGTTNIDWMIQALCPDLAVSPDIYAQLEALAKQARPGCAGVTYHPYLSELGIIAPVVARHARGQFSGLTPLAGRAELVRAVYEGVAFAIADCYAALPEAPDRLFLTGGGARSAFWSQLVADITGKTVVIPDGQELGALGAAILAAQSVGQPLKRRPLRQTHHPRPDATEQYGSAIERFRSIRQQICQQSTASLPAPAERD